MQPARWPRSWFGDFILLVFVLAQASDGVLTYVGVMLLGHRVEANPLLASYIVVLGAGPALIAAKMFAVGCGAILHRRAFHRTLGVLTIFYLAGAVLPWTMTLFPAR